MNEAPAVIRALVQHLGNDRAGLDLLNRLLEILDVRLAGLVPPPPAVDQVQVDQPQPEPVFVEPKKPRPRAQRR